MSAGYHNFTNTPFIFAKSTHQSPPLLKRSTRVPLYIVTQTTSSLDSDLASQVIAVLQTHYVSAGALTV